MENVILDQNQVSQLLTSIENSSISSSFTKEGCDYLVSTVTGHKGDYGTRIQVARLGGAEILEMAAHDAVTAAMNHIGITRMGVSTPQTEWSRDAVDSFMPHQIKEFLDKEKGHRKGDSLASEFNILLLSASGINFVPMDEKVVSKRGKPGIFHMSLYFAAMFVGGKYGWLYGHEASGMVLGVVLAIIGAVIASTMVGVVASLFGYKA